MKKSYNLNISLYSLYSAREPLRSPWPTHCTDTPEKLFVKKESWATRTGRTNIFSHLFSLIDDLFALLFYWLTKSGLSIKVSTNYKVRFLYIYIKLDMLLGVSLPIIEKLSDIRTLYQTIEKYKKKKLNFIYLISKIIYIS